MSRRAEPLSPETVATLPDRCRECLFWERGWPRPDPLRPDHVDDLAGDAARAKQGWCGQRAGEGHVPGRAVRIDGELAGWALFAPARDFTPRMPPVPPTSSGSLLLATLWVAPFHRRGGIGRLLVQAAIREALRLGLGAVEAYGDRRWRESACTMPCTWLLHEGFEVAAEHPRYPLMQIDTNRPVRWAVSLEHAVEEVVGRLRRRAARRPTPGPVTIDSR